MKWEKTMTAVKKTRMKSPRTVAIVGFASNSRHQAPYDRRDLEVWGCNEAYVAGFMENSGGDFRVDRWFQIHKHEDFSRENNSNDKRHYEWLQQEHNFPIYMQEKFEEIPNAKKLPLSNLEDMFFANLFTTTPKGEIVSWVDENDHGFYTSTFAYMMAMAIHEGFKEIEIWGFNMGTQSEYGQQAPGGTFWISAALNRGIKVTLAGSSPLMRVPMYGYDYGSILMAPDIEKRGLEISEDLPALQRKTMTLHGAKQQLEQLMQGAFAAGNETLGDDMAKMLRERMQEELEASSQYNFWLGAREECKLYLNSLNIRHKDDPDYVGWLDRLSLEVRFNFLEDEIRVCKETLDMVIGAKSETKLVIETAKMDDDLKEYFVDRGLALMKGEGYWTNRLNWHLGAQTQVKWFMLVIDSRQPNQMQEKDFGQIWVAEMFPGESDVLMLGKMEEDNGTTREEKSGETQDVSGAGGDSEQSGESGERPADPSAD